MDIIADHFVKFVGLLEHKILVVVSLIDTSDGDGF